MNSRARDIIYGRRGGRWVDDTPTRTTPPTKAASDPRCRICDAPYSRHSGRLCPVCRRPVEHHQPGDEEIEWAAAARMARARQAAITAGSGTVNGRPVAAELDDVDLEALRRADVTLDAPTEPCDGATP